MLSIAFVLNVCAESIQRIEKGKVMTDERVKEIEERRARITPGKWHNEGCVIVDENSIVVGEESYGWRFIAQVNSDTEESANKTPVITEAEAKANAEFIADAPTDIDYLLSLLPVQPAQTVGLSLLPYEIAEELPKMGGGFGELAAMCKPHVAAFIEKLISERTVQPAASTPTDSAANYACNNNQCGWVSTATSRPLSRGLKVGCPICQGDARFIGAAASAEAQDERKYDET